MAEFDLERFLPYQLAVLSSRLSRQFAALYRDRFGISIAEWRVVAHLAASDTVSVREIHHRVDMDKSKVSRAASRLERAGYITKMPDPDDRRLVALSLTEKGHAMIAELTPVAHAYQARILAQLGADAAVFRGLVTRLLNAPD